MSTNRIVTNNKILKEVLEAYQNEKLLIYCRNCGQVFSMKIETCSSVCGFYLNMLNPLADCCENPHWHFLASGDDPHMPKLKFPAKNWISGLKPQFQEEYFYRELL